MLTERVVELLETLRVDARLLRKEVDTFEEEVAVNNVLCAVEFAEAAFKKKGHVL